MRYKKHLNQYEKHNKTSSEITILESNTMSISSREISDKKRQYNKRTTSEI